jgi:hypothetical protein
MAALFREAATARRPADGGAPAPAVSLDVSVGGFANVKCATLKALLPNAPPCAFELRGGAVHESVAAARAPPVVAALAEAREHRMHRERRRCAHQGGQWACAQRGGCRGRNSAHSGNL